MGSPRIPRLVPLSSGCTIVREPQAWLADVLARIAGHPARCLDELLPWNWRRLAAGPIEIDKAA